jgi:threonine dehydrogenase-like Zn-dependent dehydrogenase
MGHEYVGVVEETGSEVRSVKPGDFVAGSFMASDNTCPICQAGYQSRCAHVEYVGAGGAQAQLLRVPLADGTLVATPGQPDTDLLPSLLAASDVLGTGWFGAVAAETGPGKTVTVIGDGAVGLLAVPAARQLGAEQIIAMSRHELRQKLALEFGATDIVTERGDEGVARVKEMTGGYGAHSIIEAVGTQESMMQAIRSTRASRIELRGTWKISLAPTTASTMLAASCPVTTGHSMISAGRGCGWLRPLGSFWLTV